MVFKKNFKRRIFTSIRGKFVIVYVLVNIISLQLIGLYFTTQLKSKDIDSFQQNIIEQEKILNYNVREELAKKNSNKSNEDTINSSITKLTSEFYIKKLQIVSVIDAESKVISSSSKNGNDDYYGKRNLDSLISQVLKTGESSNKFQVDKDTNKRVWLYVDPLKKDNEVIGAIILISDIEGVYQEINDVIRIFIVGTGFSILITIIIGFLASKTVTSSIEKMNLQVKQMGQGNYNPIVGVNTNDEIGDLAKVFNGISQKIRDEQETTESERRKLETIISSMMDGIIATDNSGKIVLINSSAENLLQKEDEIYIGKDVLKVLDITEYKTIADIIDAEDSLIVVSKGEEEILLRLEFTEILGSTEIGSFIKESDGYIIVMYDVTEQERQEKERREFVSTVSHELRTPLTTMNSYIEALEDGVIYNKELAPMFIDTIHKETSRMIRMVNDLMQLGKMDIKEEHYEKELIDINKLLESIVERFELTHTDKNFVRHIPKTPIFVEADQDKLIQVFDNIINNAVKYSPDGKNITIRVRQNYNHNRVSISIKDEGIGIPMAHIDKIFNRFYRVDKSRQRSMGGTGLGLSLAKKIIDAHKGRVWAQSREGYGSIIFVMLPCEKLDEEWL